ncbi:hypothetical protein [Thalassobaculum sp.]|uniref:hypothetical protein n=1 Tax=Thalassobaculum sp. TaxID=2022740 RepID=UPI0032EFDE11
MMDSKHTQGPWVIEDPMGPESLWIVEAGKQTYEWRCIAMVCRDDDIEVSGPKISAREQNANARLIASAPAMAEALAEAPPPPVEATVDEARAWLLEYAVWYGRTARAALSTATGEAG